MRYGIYVFIGLIVFSWLLDALTGGYAARARKNVKEEEEKRRIQANKNKNDNLL